MHEMMSDSTEMTYPIPDFSSVHVLVVGDVMLDRYWFGDVKRISPEAPVPVVKVVRCEERPGGAANVARNLAALGVQTTLLSVTGDDEAATTLVQLMVQQGVRPNLYRDASINTTVKLRVIGLQQQLLRIDFECTPDHEILEAKLEEFKRLLPDHDAIILSDYGKGGLTHIPTMISAAKAAERPVFIDPKGDDFGKYAGATAITPNRAELAAVVGRWRDAEDLRGRAEHLRESLDLEAILLTRSEEGVTLFRKNELIHEPARAREVYDVSGAGDTVIAVLSAALAAGSGWNEAVRLANLAAGIVVGKLGTAVATLAEIRSAQ